MKLLRNDMQNQIRTYLLVCNPKVLDTFWGRPYTGQPDFTCRHGKDNQENKCHREYNHFFFVFNTNTDVLDVDSIKTQPVHLNDTLCVCVIYTCVRESHVWMNHNRFPSFRRDVIFIFTSCENTLGLTSASYIDV